MQSRAWSPGCRGRGLPPSDGCGGHPRRCPGRRAVASSLSRAPRARRTGVGRGKRAAPLLQNIPWVRLVQQALLMRSIILLQNKVGGGGAGPQGEYTTHGPTPDPQGWVAGLAPCGPALHGEGELPDAGREQAAGHGWGGPGRGAGEAKGKKGDERDGNGGGVGGGNRGSRLFQCPLPSPGFHVRWPCRQTSFLPAHGRPARGWCPAPGHCTA